MLPAAYLEDLGGLDGRMSLVLLDLRGTGESEVPEDTQTFRCDWQVSDVEALREELGLEKVTLLGHSAGTNLVVAYAARYPERVEGLVMVTPSVRGVGLEVTDQDRREVAEGRSAEPWFPEAFAALQRIWVDGGGEQEWKAITPFTYGRWDEETREYAETMDSQRNNDAAMIFGSAGAFDPAGTKKALSELDVPVLVVAGEADISLPPRIAKEYAGLFKRAKLEMLAGGGHSPWRDDPGWFVRTVAGFAEAEMPVREA
jgi:pimeloyl-ACP methyl ester carboxylesterase